MSAPIGAVGYIRVSTRLQAAEGLSLAAQRDRIAAYYSAQGYSLVHVRASSSRFAMRA